MALKLQVISSVGEREVELRPPEDDRPLVIGRGAEAEVVVVSPGVSRRHCILYVHQGQWAIHDAGSSRGTFVNGQRIVEPTYLHGGDEIALGDEPDAAKLIVATQLAAAGDAADRSTSSMPSEQATIADRPASAASLMPSGGARPQMPTYPGAPRAISSAVPGSAIDIASAPPPMPAYNQYAAVSSAGNYDAAVEQPSTQAQSDNEYSSDGAESSGAQDWMTAATAAARARRAAKRPRRSNGPPVGAIVLAVLLGGGVIACIVIFVLHGPPKPPPQVVQHRDEPVVSGPVKQKHTIFMNPSPPGTKGPQIASQSPAGVTPLPATGAASDAEQTASGATLAGAMPDKHRQAIEDAEAKDPDWQRVEQAHDTLGDQEPELAVVAYDDYRYLNPKTPFVKDLDAYTDEAIDRLWWMRIVAALRERASLRDQIREDRQNVADAAEQSTKDKFNQRKAAAQEQLDRVDGLLKTMEYTSNDEPVIDDTAAIARLRKARDPKMFEKFKELTLREIRRSRRLLPWHIEGTH